MQMSTAAGRSTSIDWDFIRRKEGDVHEPYLPVEQRTKGKLSADEKYSTDSYRAIGNSGVTVGSGIDLGQQNLTALLIKISNPILRDSIAAKLGRFFGRSKRRDAAVTAMDKAETVAIGQLQSLQPELMSVLGIAAGEVVMARAQVGRVFDHASGRETPHVVIRLGLFGRAVFGLSQPEIDALEQAIKQMYAEALASAFDRVADKNLLFGLLPTDAQTAMMSLHYHTGSMPGGKRHVSFWRAMGRGDLDKAVEIFESEIVNKSDPKYVRRRRDELVLLRKAAKTWAEQRGREPRRP
jgi:GH24 family phage-related lysozyme (muramidase)